ncbi:mechanosensitive ion channel family protein [Pseudoxanthomonas winnipegensis]|nr:mechanosensitive ion channel family protein [Pseudoxanthomonas winnipegensis]
MVSFHSVSRAARRLWLLSALLVLAAGQALAQGPAAPAPSVDEALQQIDDALSTLQDQSKDEQVPENLHALGLQVADAQRQADAQALALQPQLDEIDERLKQLGDLAPGTREASDIAAERKQLQASHDRLDGAIKRAKLLSVEAQQLGDAIEKARARQLSEQLFARVASPLSPTLWRQMAQAWPDDVQRLRAVGQDLMQALQQGVATHGTAPLATGIAIALLILLPGALALRWVGQRYVIQRTPGGRLRRSALAVWTLVLGTALPTIAAWVLIDTLRAIQAIPEDLDGLADAVVRVTFFSAFVGATSAALLLPRQPSWRLLPFDDDTAVKLGRYAWLTSVAVWLSGMLTALNRVARTNPVTGVGVDGVIALVFVALVIAMLVSLLRIHRGPVEAAAEGGEAAASAVPQRRSGVVVLVSLLAQLVVAAALVGAVLGYVNFARAATQQIIWAVVVCGAGGLLMMFADDLSQWLFKPDSRFGKAASVGLGLRSSHMEQAAVLTAAVARLWLVLMVIGALLVPYGANFTSITDWIAQARKAWSASGLPLQPWDVLRAVLVALIGLTLVKAAHRWLVRTYLPSTELELSTRASVAAVMRYLGITVVALCVLVTLGLDMTKLAIVASALSVGIGFGLQAITQNFISGLILMAERPVKIGDWVRIGDAEGDVRRINVRSTEIQVSDRSTLIVPNSDLITKTIRNMTMAGPLGRVQLQFSVPLGTDVAAVRTLLLDLYAAHENVLAEPAPSVFIDSIAGGMIAINSFAYVPSPRATYGTRSDLFFQLLQALADAQIALVTPQDVRIVDAAPPATGQEHAPG